MLPDIALITNSRSAGQPSMVGYGKLLLDELAMTSLTLREVRGSDLFSRISMRRPVPKLARNLDRFLISPGRMLGTRARIAHAVDPGNAVYFPLIMADATMITVHDMIPYLALEGRIAGFRPSCSGRWLMEAVLRRIRKANIIITCSYTTRADLIRIAGVDERRVFTVYNCVPSRLKRERRAERCAFRRKYRIPLCVPVVAHIGREFYKNHAGVLDVFSRVLKYGGTAHLVLVTAATDELKRHIRTLHLNQDVTIIPELKAEDVSSFYSTAAVLLFPSLYEGFGLPVIEAQQCGTPVVCSGAGALGEIAAGGAFVHDVADHDGMARSTELALRATATAAAMSKAGRQNALRFTRASFKAAYENLYIQLLEQIEVRRRTL